MHVYDKLKDLFVEIGSVYRILYNIESIGNINSTLFSRNVEKLKIMLKEEEKLLNELVLCDDYDLIRDEIFSYVGNDDFYLRIRDFLVSYDGVKVEILEQDDEDLIDLKLTTKNIAKLFIVSAKNIFRVYSYFLQSTIDKLMVREIKDKLLKLKYYNCLVKHDVEDAMISTNFSVTENVYTDMDIFTDLVNLDDFLCEKIILDGYMTSIEDTLEKLMNTSDKEYSNDSSMLVIGLHLQCLLKACFAIMNDYEYKIIIGQVEEKLKRLINEGNLGSLENVVDIINNRNEYRSNVRKLSLKPLKYD